MAASFPAGEYERVSLTTYGTHDHDPLLTMWKQLHTPGDENAARELDALCRYAGIPAPAPEEFTPEVHTALLRTLFASNSWIAVVMITDVFGRGERFNLPGVASDGNWTQRLHAPVSEISADPAVERVRQIIAESGRTLPGPQGA